LRTAGELEPGIEDRAYQALVRQGDELLRGPEVPADRRLGRGPHGVALAVQPRPGVDVGLPLLDVAVERPDLVAPVRLVDGRVDLFPVDLPAVAGLAQRALPDAQGLHQAVLEPQSH